MIKARVNDLGDKVTSGKVVGTQPSARPQRKKPADGEAPSSVTLEMFQQLEDTVYSMDQSGRVDNLENQIKVLKKMGASVGGSSAGNPDLLDTFNEIIEKNK